MTPLYDHETEAAVFDLVGAASTLDPGRARVLAEQLQLDPADFHLPAHAELWAAVLGLLRSGKPADLLTVEAVTGGSEAIAKAGGRKFLAPLLMGSRLDEHALPAYADNLRALALRRRLLAAAKALASAAQDGGMEPGAVLNEGAAALAALTRRNGTTRTLQAHLESVMDQLGRNASGEADPIIATGVEALDEAIHGMQQTLTVVGAGPGIGKSALFGRIADNLAARGVKVGLFSLEDAGDWLAWRLLSHEANIPQPVLRFRRLHQGQMTDAGAGLNRLWERSTNILVDDRSGLTAQEVVQSARDMVLNHGCKVILVDHLGELRYTSGRRERFDLDVAEGLSDLRAIAKTYGVPVWCATHLNRKTDEQEAPRLSNFANSAAVERQARVALALTKDSSGRVVAWVLKQTNSVAGLKVVLKFAGAAALVRNDGGDVVDSQAEGRP